MLHDEIQQVANDLKQIEQRLDALEARLVALEKQSKPRHAAKPKGATA